MVDNLICVKELSGINKGNLALTKKAILKTPLGLIATPVLSVSVAKACHFAKPMNQSFPYWNCSCTICLKKSPNLNKHKCQVPAM